MNSHELSQALRLEGGQFIRSPRSQVHFGSDRNKERKQIIHYVDYVVGIILSRVPGVEKTAVN